MKKLIVLSMLMLSGSTALAAKDAVRAVEGTVKSVDRAGKVLVVETEDGTKHVYHYSEDQGVHVGDGTKDALHGVAEGTKVAVHFTASAGGDMVHEIDRLGGDGLKVVKGTVEHLNRGARTISIATVDGTVVTMKLTARAAHDSARDLAKGTKKSVKVSVYYTEKDGEKTVHFIGRAI
jgi:hypothetical protein